MQLARGDEHEHGHSRLCLWTLVKRIVKRWSAPPSLLESPYLCLSLKPTLVLASSSLKGAHMAEPDSTSVLGVPVYSAVP